MREFKLTALMAATSFLLCSGLITNNRQMYWMASVLGLLMGGAYLLVRYSAQGLSVQRQAPAEMMEGESAEVVLTLQLRSRVLSEAQDEIPPAFEVEPLPPTDDRQTQHYRLTARRRGLHRLGPVQVVLSDPFGLFFHRKSVPVYTELMVLPRPIALPNWHWEGGGRGRYTASSVNRGQRGEGTDWHGTRPYVPGDPLRRINWRATARHHTWHVQEFESSQLAPVLIALDLAPTWRAEGESHPEFDQALRHIAWLVLEAPRQAVRLMVYLPGSEPITLNQNNPNEYRQFLRQLALLQPVAQTSLLDELPRLVQQYGDQYRIVLFVPPTQRVVYESAVPHFGGAVEVV